MLGQALPRLRTTLPPVKMVRSNFNEIKAHFKNLKKLGQGAFGAAYSATYRGEPVIVKVSVGMPGIVSIAEAIDVMKREVRILGRLQKLPFVPRLVEVGIDYFVQEDVEGISLLDLLDKKGMEPREVLSVVVSSGIIASTLHNEGIAHGDFEARNILVTPEGTVAIDFGLSVAREDGEKAFKEALDRDIIAILENLTLVLSVPEVPQNVRIMITGAIEKYRKIVMAGKTDEDTAKELSRELLFALSQLGARAIRGRELKRGHIRVIAV